MPKKKPLSRKESKGKKTDLAEVISLVFVMGQFMKERMHRRFDRNRCGSFLEFETLRYVNEHEYPFMRDITKKFHVTPPATTLLIDGLVEQGFLERLVDPKDRRSVRIGLTGHGKRFLERGIAQQKRKFAQIFGILNSEERTQFASILRKIMSSDA